MTLFHHDDWLDIYEGDCREQLRSLPEASVHAVITSPPFFGLRDYGIPPVVWGGDDHDHVWGAHGRAHHPGQVAQSVVTNDAVAKGQTAGSGQHCECGAWLGQLGLEPTPEMYVAHLVEVFREVRRVLHPSGTAWLNLGDSFNAARNGGHAGGQNGMSRPEIAVQRSGANVPGLKPKDLIGIPWMAAFALRSDGWYLRRDAIWAKGNPMPESVMDRPTSSHEYVFMLTANEDYYYDRIATLEPPSESVLRAVERPLAEDRQYQHDTDTRMGKRSPNRVWSDPDARARMVAGRQLRSVWNINTRPYPGAHFAVFPPKLVETPLFASTSEKGVCPECLAPWVRLIMPGLLPKDMDRPQAARAMELYEAAGLTEDHIRAIQNVGVSDAGKSALMQSSASTEAQLFIEAKEALGGYTREFLLAGEQAVGWRPGCGHGWGGNPDDLDIIASPNVAHRGEQADTLADRMADPQRRRGLARDRLEGEGRRYITRFEQRAYAKQMKAWDAERKITAYDDIAQWLGRLPESTAWHREQVAQHPAEEAWRHYVRVDPRGARAIPKALFETWTDRGWLTPVEPPDYSGALAPIPAAVLDPFGGSGTVGLVAQQYGRRAVLIDLNAKYLRQQMARASRLFGTGGSYVAEAEEPAPPVPDGLWA